MKIRPTLSSLYLLVACGMFSIAVWLMPTASSEGAVPALINYQGKLTTASGGCLNDTVQMTFSIYPDTLGSPADWTETQNSVIVKEGIFNVLLGSVNSIPDTVFDGSIKYLGVQVESDPEMRPLKPMVSTGYSFRSQDADTAEYARAAPAVPDDDWAISGDDIYRLTGNVGIGTAYPDERLHVRGPIMSEGTAGSESLILRSSASGGHQYEWYVDGAGVGTMELWDRTAAASRLVVDAQGNVGISTTSPSAKVHIDGGSTPEVLLIESDNDEPWGLVMKNKQAPGRGMGIFQLDAGPVWIQNNYPIGAYISLRHDNGNVGVRVLEITGGSDLAEPFPMTDPESIPKGALVIIDDQNPGKLKLSDRSYDTRVAGVVSGAGGIHPGLTLTQESMFEGGQNVAISGRVYALADASYDAIKPGDLLTTSDTPGHAMKATDRDRAYGAVIGKAMTGLEEGKGLVLVLVNLQ